MVSPAAVQRSQTVSHKQPAEHVLWLLKDDSKHQPSLRTSHSVVKSQRLFHIPSSQIATSCPPARNDSGPSQKNI